MFVCSSSSPYLPFVAAAVVVVVCLDLSLLKTVRNFKYLHHIECSTSHFAAFNAVCVTVVADMCMLTTFSIMVLNTLMSLTRGIPFVDIK